MPITKNTSEAVATFTIQGIPYLAFANAHRKNEVRKWNGDGFTDISDNIPNSIYTDKQGTTGFTNTKGVTTFNIGGTTYLAFANSSQKNEVRKWNGDGFTDISDNIPHSTYDYYSNSVSSDAYGVTSFEIDGETYLAFANMGGGSLQAQPNEVRKWNGDGFTDISTTIPSTKNNSYGVTSVEIG
ncbi:MAG: hypothetical protein LBP53_06640 [Candidatus Peribacteria bacterium]|nr:hypothetical protein [Candidatus Peribacteria bacterium]